MSTSVYKLLVIDAKGLLYRAHDSHRMLSAKVDGEEIATGGVYGMLGMLPRIHQRYGRPRLAIAWEGRRNFRIGMYPQYKGRDIPPDEERRELNDEMALQEKHLIDCFRTLGVAQYRCPEGEADDCMARLAAETAGPVLIYTGDSDLRQLVDKRVLVAAPGKKGDVIYDAKKVREFHGVEPKHIAQLKALAGDGSDHIPGVPGIGPVAAALLLNHYGTLKATLAAAGEAPGVEGWPGTERQRALIHASSGWVKTFFQLTKLRTDLKMETISEPGVPSQRAAIAMCRKYRFQSLEHPNELQGLLALGKS